MFAIRSAEQTDLKEIEDFLRRYDLYLAYMEEQYLPNFLVAVDGNEVVGCVKHIITEKNLFRIKSLAVSEEHRRKDIGTKLVLSKIEEAALKGFTEVYAGMLKENNPVKSLFESLGFQRIQQEEYTIFNECERCMPDFVNKWSYCKSHSNDGKCPKYFYRLSFYELILPNDYLLKS
jgi:N-acetylglutamate synthase-like GNAT family acetyltransferase